MSNPHAASSACAHLWVSRSTACLTDQHPAAAAARLASADPRLALACTSLAAVIANKRASRHNALSLCPCAAINCCFQLCEAAACAWSVAVHCRRGGRPLVRHGQEPRGALFIPAVRSQAQVIAASSAWSLTFDRCSGLCVS